MCSIVPGDLSYLHTVSIPLQNGTTFCKGNCFLNRIGFYNNKPANGFLDIAKGPVGYHTFVPNHAAVVEGQAGRGHGIIRQGRRRPAGAPR